VDRDVLRFLLWRLLAVLAVLASYVLVGWFLHGGPGRLLRGSAPPSPLRSLGALLTAPLAAASSLAGLAPYTAFAALASLIVGAIALAIARWLARRRRRYVRVALRPYRADHATAEAIVSMYAALHKRLLQRWWRRLVLGQPSVALEVRYQAGGEHQAGAPAGRLAWTAVACPREELATVETALRVAYPNCSLGAPEPLAASPPVLLRLKKDAGFIKRVKSLDHFEHEREPSIDRVLNLIGTSEGAVLVQLSLTPTPAVFDRLARHAFKAHEARLSRERRARAIVQDRSLLDDAELRGGLDVQHRPLFFAEFRVACVDRRTCERVASAYRADGAENRLVERGTTIRHGLLALYARRLERGEGNPLPPFRKGVFATTELASLWHLPSVGYAAVPFARGALPLAPAPPAIDRPRHGAGTLRDTIGAVSIEVALRRQNTAVTGTVEQGKSSYLIATVAEDLRRERCAVIVFDPKGDAAEAAVSRVDPSRTCTLLDFARPTCGFNPLAVDAPADVIADYVVAALKNLFTDADIRASSDRYLRNAIIAVLAYDRASTLWDAARLLSVGEDGYAYRQVVGARVRTLPAFKEISDFFTAELTAQLADARRATRSCGRFRPAEASARFGSPATKVIWRLTGSAASDRTSSM
jgi:hypothetical protein